MPAGPRLVPALVVQDLLDDVRHDPEIGHARGDGSAEIVRRPCSSTPERASSDRLPRDHAVKPPPRVPNNCRGDAMRGTALMMSSMAGISGSVWARSFLAPRRRQRPRAGFSKSNLAPAHAADLLPSAPGQDQEPDAAAMIVVAARLPDRGQFGVRQHALARLAALRRRRADHRVGFGQALRERPSEQRGKLGAGERGDNRAALQGDAVQPGGNVRAGDLVEREAVQRPEITLVGEIARLLGEGARDARRAA